MANREPRIDGVLFDFYGTLAHATSWLGVDVVLAQHGVLMTDEHRDLWWNGGLDGVEHMEHSASREDYAAWQRSRLLAMLAATDLHPGEHESIVEKLEAGTATRVLEAYPEAAEVLAQLRERGLRLAVCSNWDWDLAEAIEEVGLTDAVDVVVSSAWVGARKPHPRIYEATRARLGIEADRTLFVGDTWGPDVVGPLAAGMTPLYLRRDGHWPDESVPDDEPSPDVATGVDLRAVLELGRTPRAASRRRARCAPAR